MSREEAIKILNDYDINFERNTPEEVAEAHEMAIKALESQPSENELSENEKIAEAFDIAIKTIKTIPSEDEKIIRIKKGTLKARTGRFVIYDVEWLKTHFNTTEAKIYGQPKEESQTDKALNLLAEWAIECGFGYDNIPEEYEKYKDDIAEMGYTEGLVYIVKMESEAQE